MWNLTETLYSDAASLLFTALAVSSFGLQFFFFILLEVIFDLCRTDLIALLPLPGING